MNCGPRSLRTSCAFICLSFFLFFENWILKLQALSQLAKGKVLLSCCSWSDIVDSPCLTQALFLCLYYNLDDCGPRPWTNPYLEGVFSPHFSIHACRLSAPLPQNFGFMANASVWCRTSGSVSTTIMTNCQSSGLLCLLSLFRWGFYLISPLTLMLPRKLWQFLQGRLSWHQLLRTFPYSPK